MTPAAARPVLIHLAAPLLSMAAPLVVLNKGALSVVSKPRVRFIPWKLSMSPCRAALSPRFNTPAEVSVLCWISCNETVLMVSCNLIGIGAVGSLL